MKRLLRWLIGISVISIGLLLCWAISENKALQLHMIPIKDEQIPKAFNGYSIAHLSDLHSEEMGHRNESLLNMLRESHPDIIAITGDLLDCKDTDPTIAIDFCAEAVKIAPVYYVTGNHESRFEPEFFNMVMQGLRDVGVQILEDEEVLLTRDGSTISLVGHQWGDTKQIGLLSNFEGFQILLSHHPEAIDDYAAGGYDLVLSGHAHGGQFRLPWIGGLIAPGQGLFPRYTSGRYQVGDTQLVVSRGIGNSGFPLRFNNRPEVILIILEA